MCFRLAFLLRLNSKSKHLVFPRFVPTVLHGTPHRCWLSTLNCRLSAPRFPSLNRIGKPLSGVLFTNQPAPVPLMLAPPIDLPLTSQLEPTLTPVVTIRSDRSAPVLSARMLYAQTLSAQIFSAPMSSAASLCRSDQTEPSHSYLDSI